AIDRRGAAAFFLSDERGDRQNPFGGAYRDVVDIGQAQAVIGPEPDVDVDFLAVQPIDAGAPAADARLYRRADILHGDTEPGHALAVALHVLLRPALLVARVRGDAARDFQDAIDDLLRQLAGDREIVTAQLKLERAALIAAAAAEQPAEHAQARLGRYLDIGARDRSRDGPAYPVGERHRGDAPLAGLHERELDRREIVARVVDDVAHVLRRDNLTNGFVEQLHVLVHDGDIRAVVHAHPDLDLVAVRLRGELERNQRHGSDGKRDEREGRADHGAAPVERPIDELRVLALERRHLPLAPMRIGLHGQEAAREHRHERHRDQQRAEEGERDDEGQLLEQRARRRAHERDRQEDHASGQGRRDDRAGHLLRADQRGLLAGCAALTLPEDVLEHDDRVVDDHADAERDAAEA